MVDAVVPDFIRAWVDSGIRVVAVAVFERDAITVFVGAMAFARTPWELLALRLMQGVFSGFVAPSLTLVSIGAPAHLQGRIAGSLQVAMGLGAVGGPLMGELLREAAGIGAVYLCVSLLSGSAALPESRDTHR